MGRHSDGLLPFALITTAALWSGCGVREARTDAALDLEFLRSRPVSQPQFALAPEGTLYVLWREPGEAGADLYLVRRGEDGGLTDPIRVNDSPGIVEKWDLDENRASIAFAGAGIVTVAWGSRDGNVRAAVSRDAGVSFEPASTLNLDGAEGVYHAYPEIAVDESGVVHAFWIDARNAEAGAEEPADLYYARVQDGAVSERNLTADQEPSICGCCRIDVARSGETLNVAFRNTDADGYRDVFRLVGNVSGVFESPARLGPPMWKLDGCPMFGPLNVGATTLWTEGSTGKRRLFQAEATDGSAELVLEDSESWTLERPPRFVETRESNAPLVLLPGRPTTRLLRLTEGTWTTVVDDLPSWAMSGFLEGGVLTVLGAVEDRALWQQTRLAE
jgi:hypothetical protein